LFVILGIVGEQFLYLASQKNYLVRLTIAVISNPDVMKAHKEHILGTSVHKSIFNYRITNTETKSESTEFINTPFPYSLE